MNIINFSCHTCNDLRSVYYPPTKFESLNEALKHLKDEPEHVIFILENESVEEND